jgi:thiol-disulfide isomerase/thioredoxin
VSEVPAGTSEAPAAPRRRRWGRTAIELAVVFTLFFALRSYQRRDLVSGEPPALPTVLLDGSAAPARPVAVHFFASWCGVCSAEEGNVRTLAEHHEILAVASQSGDAGEVRAFLETHDLGPAAIAIDPRGELARSFGVSAFPATFFLDEAGHVVTSEVGYTTTLGLLLRAAWAR